MHAGGTEDEPEGGDGAFPTWETEAGSEWIDIPPNLHRQVGYCSSLAPAAALQREPILPQLGVHSTRATFHIVKSCQMTESDLKNVRLVRAWQVSGYMTTECVACQGGKWKELETRQKDPIQDGETTVRGVFSSDVKGPKRGEPLTKFQ